MSQGYWHQCTPPVRYGFGGVRGMAIAAREFGDRACLAYCVYGISIHGSRLNGKTPQRWRGSSYFNTLELLNGKCIVHPSSQVDTIILMSVLSWAISLQTQRVSLEGKIAIGRFLPWVDLAFLLFRFTFTHLLCLISKTCTSHFRHYRLNYVSRDQPFFKISVILILIVLA